MDVYVKEMDLDGERGGQRMVVDGRRKCSRLHSSPVRCKDVTTRRSLYSLWKSISARSVTTYHISSPLGLGLGSVVSPHVRTYAHINPPIHPVGTNICTHPQFRYPRDSSY